MTTPSQTKESVMRLLAVAAILTAWIWGMTYVALWITEVVHTAMGVPLK